MADELKTLVIKSSEWHRGQLYLENEDGIPSGSGISRLLMPGYYDDGRSAGKRCCLGILARDLGARDEDLLDVAYPRHKRTACAWPDAVLWLEEAIGLINDDGRISDADRLARLGRLFAEFGYQIDYRPDE